MKNLIAAILALLGIDRVTAPPRPPQVHTVNQLQLPAVGDYNVWRANAAQVDREYFNGWFKRKNYLNLVAAMCMVESSGGRFLTREVSARDTSYGVMQVTPYTASDIFSRGYNRFRPTQENLMTVRGGLYFGMAYIKILHDDFGLRTKEQITKAYNGGPGWSRRGARTAQMVQRHWGRVSDFLA